MRSLVWLLAVVSTALGVETKTITFAGVEYTVCAVDLTKEKLELFLDDDSGKPLNTFARLDEMLGTKGRRLHFAMNTGMYHKDYSPVGLYMADGRQIAPLNLRVEPEGNFFLKPNAVFAVSDRGAFIVESSQFPAVPGKIHLATQSGPALVLGGKIHPKFTPGSKNQLRRNGVGVVNAQRVVFVVSEAAVNFHDFARFFRDELKCTDALFLDGTVCSLHFAPLKRSDFRINFGPMIGVTEAVKPR
jgi:uncharacterized protein YigE (DUF2233 family)